MSVDFATLLFIALTFTGVVWLVDSLWFAKRRAAKGDDSSPKTHQPLLVEYCRAFFPVILAVFVLRSFVAEPFRIPSGSMLPTLHVGDFILVNKFTYGIRLPVVNRKVIPLGNPARGDVVVFRYPPDPSIDYIKRIVGLPGDRISYRDKVLRINGEPVALERIGGIVENGNGRRVLRFMETLGEHRHPIQWLVDRPSADGEVVVPQGHYFVMGDNRDNSRDSRFWGFVPDGNLVGKAFFIWMSWDGERHWIDFSRIGKTIP